MQYCVTRCTNSIQLILFSQCTAQGSTCDSVCVSVWVSAFFSLIALAWCRRQTQYDVARLLLMAPKFGKAMFCAIKTDKIREHSFTMQLRKGDQFFQVREGFKKVNLSR